MTSTTRWNTRALPKINRPSYIPKSHCIPHPSSSSLKNPSGHPQHTSTLIHANILISHAAPDTISWLQSRIIRATSNRHSSPRQMKKNRPSVPRSNLENRKLQRPGLVQRPAELGLIIARALQAIISDLIMSRKRKSKVTIDRSNGSRAGPLNDPINRRSVAAADAAPEVGMIENFSCSARRAMLAMKSLSFSLSLSLQRGRREVGRLLAGASRAKSKSGRLEKC